MPECAHRFSPRVPGEIDVAKPPQQVGRLPVQRLQPGVFDAPLSGQPADDELAVAADRDRERVRPRTDPLQKIFQAGNQGTELGLVVRHVVPELDLPRGDGPLRSGDLVAAIPLAGVAKRPAVEDDRVIGSWNGPCWLQTGVAHGWAGRGAHLLPAGQGTLQIAHEVDQLLLGERLRVDIQMTVRVSISPVTSSHA